MSTLTRGGLIADLLAGLTGAIIVLPQGIAYALIAGLPPEYGLYTAIITPIVAGLFGSSLHLISGPTAAISIVVMSVVSGVVSPESSEFIPAVLALTIMAGLLQFGLGVARLGTLVNFISHTVVIGFTAGAAILIGTSQLKYAMAVSVPSGSSFTQTWSVLTSQVSATNFYALTTALVTIIATLVIKRINRKWPAMLIGMVVGSFYCWIVNGADHGVALVGALSGTLPHFAIPGLGFDAYTALVPGAVAVAILGLVEAVSIGRAVALRSGQRIDGNQEFIGQGLSNVVGGFFSCYAGSGSFTRTGVNYDSGAKTPFAAIFAAIVLIVILLFVPQITALLPLPAMAGAILLIAWGLIDSHHIATILRSSRQEAAVLLVTFFATLFVELEFAIYLGVCISIILYLKRTSTPKLLEVAPHTISHGTDFRHVVRHNLKVCPQIRSYRLDGSVYFGAVDYVQGQFEALRSTRDHYPYLLLDCSGINFIDLSGVEMLSKEFARFEQSGVSITLCNLKNIVREQIIDLGFEQQIVSNRCYQTADLALEQLVPILDAERCKNCIARVYKQCPPQFN